MDLKSKAQIDRIKKASRIVMRTCKVLQWLTIPLLVAMVTIVIIMPASPNIKLGVNGIDITTNELNPTLKAILIIVWSLNLVVFFKLLHHMIKLFRNFANGDIFSKESIGQIKHLGFTVLYFAGLHVLMVPLWFVIQKHRNFVFQGNVGITLGDCLSLGTIVVGCLVILISWIMDVGRDMHEESELTI
jgi:hypothetical protein